MSWLDILMIAVAGGVLGLVVGKLIVQRPYYLERVRPKFWMRIAKKMKREDWLKLIATALAFTIVGYYLIEYPSVFIGRRWELVSPENIFIQLETAAPFVLYIIILIVPILEEWVFRGILLEELSRRSHSRLLGVFLSALLFALFHLSNPGYLLPSIIPLLMAGLLFGVCYLHTGLAGAVICHSTYNLLLTLGILPMPGI